MAKRKLNRLNIPQKDRWGVISGEFEDILLQYLAGKDSALGDSTGKNGHIGKFMGFNLYLSNALAWSAKLVFGAVAGEGETVVLNGVTFTWNATLGSTEGCMHITSSATAEAANFAAALTAPDTAIAEAADTGFSPFTTAAYLKALSGITATAATGTLTILFEGKGWVAVSETLSNVNSVFTTATQIQHNLFGQGKPVDLVIQKYPKVEVKDRTGYIGKDFVTWQLHGLKTFDENDACLCDVKLLSSSWT